MRRIAALALASLMVGCSSPRMDGYVELLNAEKRALEDELYDLEYDYDVQHRELQRMAAENHRLRSQAGAGPHVSETTNPRSPIIEAPDPGSLPVEPAPAIGDPPIESLPPAIVDEEDQGSPPTAAPAPLDASPINDGASPPEIPDPPIETSATQASFAWDAPPDAPAWETAPSRIEAAAEVADLDDQQGPDGCRLLLKAMDDQGNAVPIRGALEVALIDGPELRPDRVIARWSFQESELREAEGPGHSVVLQMAWSTTKPPARDLGVMAVRWRTRAGETFDARVDVAIRPGQWRPR